MSGGAGKIQNNNNQIENKLDEKPKPKPIDLKLFQSENVFTDSKRDGQIGGDLLKYRLNRDFNLFQQTDTTQPAAVQNPTDVDPKKVAEAVKNVKESLSQSVTDWDVTHTDLQNVQKTFQNLNQAEANEVFSKLSEDDLQNWGEEINGLLGSYDRNEKQQLFNDLAGKLSGENLAKFSKYLGNDPADYDAFGQAVGQNASSDAKVDFIKNIAGSVEQSQFASKAAANVLIGMQNDPAALDKALGSMTDTQLQKMMEKISVDGYSSAYGTQTISYKGEQLGKLLEAVSKSQDAGVKSRVFNSAAMQLKSIDDAANIRASNTILGKDQAAAQIRDGLTKLFNSDTNKIADRLTYDPAYRDGEAVTAYLKSMLKNDQTEEVGNIIAKLSKGDNLQEDQTTRFKQFTTDEDGNKRYNTAGVLGYFNGALVTANQQAGKDTEKQAETFKKIFSVAAGKTGVEGIPAIGVDQMIDELSKNIVDDLSKGRNAKTGDLLKLTYPNLAGNDSFYKSEAFSQYEERADHIIKKN